MQRPCIIGACWIVSRGRRVDGVLPPGDIECAVLIGNRQSERGFVRCLATPIGQLLGDLVRINKVCFVPIDRSVCILPINVAGVRNSFLITAAISAEQQGRNRCLSRKERDCEGITSLAVLQRGIGACLQQQFANVETPPGCRQHQWRLPTVIGCVNFVARAQM